LRRRIDHALVAEGDGGAVGAGWMVGTAAGS
jgi:hypothetical protein